MADDGVQLPFYAFFHKRRKLRSIYSMGFAPGESGYLLFSPLNLGGIESIGNWLQMFDLLRYPGGIIHHYTMGFRLAQVGELF